MKRLLSIAFVLSLATAFAADVQFNLKDFIASVQQLQRKVVMIEPAFSARGNSTNVIVAERRFFNTGTSGVFTATNMSDGIYRCTVNGLTWTSVFRISIPSTNGTLIASALLISPSDSALDTEEGESIDLE